MTTWYWLITFTETIFAPVDAAVWKVRLGSAAVRPGTSAALGAPKESWSV